MDESPTADGRSTRTAWWFAGGVGVMAAVLRSVRTAVPAALLQSLEDELRLSCRARRGLGSVWTTAEDVRRAALDRRSRLLRRRAAREQRRRRAGADLTGTWWTPSGATYRFDQYGDRVVFELELGVVDPRMAAEIISTSFYVCVLKGLHHSPQVVPLDGAPQVDALTVEDVSCLVIPDCVLGIPTLAALEQGIPVIAVRENRNLLRNDLRQLPWAPDQLHVVENYWEAIGVMAALRAGIEPAVVRRPLADTRQLVFSDGHLAKVAGDGQVVHTQH